MPCPSSRRASACAKDGVVRNIGTSTLIAIGFAVALGGCHDETDDAPPPPLLDAGSSIRLLKAECARRGLSTEGCAEKGDLLRLLGIPV